MNRRLLVLLFAAVLPSSLRADGGTVRLSERKGDYRITVFTAPIPFRAGPVDVSVFVQYAATGEVVPEARVSIRAAPRGRSSDAVQCHATVDAATNKLFQAALFDLPEPGWWEMEVAVEGARGTVSVHFEVEAAEVVPSWSGMWPWFSWPVMIVALFGVHQLLVRRKTHRLHEPNCAGSP
jgi:hypothetical protein